MQAEASKCETASYIRQEQTEFSVNTQDKTARLGKNHWHRSPMAPQTQFYEDSHFIFTSLAFGPNKKESDSKLGLSKCLLNDYEMNQQVSSVPPRPNRLLIYILIINSRPPISPSISWDCSDTHWKLLG